MRKHNDTIRLYNPKVDKYNIRDPKKTKIKQITDHYSNIETAKNTLTIYIVHSSAYVTMYNSIFKTTYPECYINDYAYSSHSEFNIDFTL